MAIIITALITCRMMQAILNDTGSRFIIHFLSIGLNNFYCWRKSRMYRRLFYCKKEYFFCNLLQLCPPYCKNIPILGKNHNKNTHNWEFLYNFVLMLLQIVFFLPCLVSLLWFFTFMLKSRTQRQSLLMWMQGAGVVYFAALALYILPNTDYLDMVVIDSVGTPMIFVMLAMTVLYLHLHRPDTRLNAVHLLLGIPAIVEGVIVNLMYYLEGYDRVARMVEVYDKTGALAPEFQTGPIKLLNFFGDTALNVLALSFMATMVVQSVLLLKNGGYRPGDIFRFFFKKHASTPTRVTAVLFLAMILVLLPIATMGRSFVFNHPLLGATTTICLAALLHLIAFVEFFGGHKKEVSLHFLSNVRDEDAEENAVESKVDVDVDETAAVGSEEIAEPHTQDTDAHEDETPVKPVRVSNRTRMMEQRLLQLFEKENIYCEDDLTLDTLAERMGVSAKTLSPFISSHFGVPFRTLLNNYRVEAVKSYLLKNPTATQEVVAGKCGYKDASALNRKFKEATGETPLMWLAKQTKA